jgi:hypothetical protein
MHPSQKPRSADTTHQRCSVGADSAPHLSLEEWLIGQQKGNPTYALLFAGLDKPCLWYHPSPMEKASQIRSETRIGARKHRRNDSGEYQDQD